MEKTLDKALHKYIRILPEHRERLEAAAEGTHLTDNQLLVELAMETLDRREWLTIEAQVRVARASLFAAHVLTHDFISTTVPDPELSPPSRPAAHLDAVEDDSPLD